MRSRVKAANEIVSSWKSRMHAAARVPARKYFHSIDRATITIRKDRSNNSRAIQTLSLSLASELFCRPSACSTVVCLRKRVNGKVNDGEVLINGSTMGVEFAGFGEARFFQFPPFFLCAIIPENRWKIAIFCAFINSFPKRGARCNLVKEKSTNR